jgi:uncharacterized membrane protein
VTAPARPAAALAALGLVVLTALAAWLLNVPPLVVGAVVGVSVLLIVLWLLRNGFVGKRSGAAEEKREPSCPK